MADYTGGTESLPTGRDTPTVDLPVDGEPRAAESVNKPFRKVADFLRRLMDKAGFLDVASTWSAAQTFASGIFTSLTATTGTITTLNSTTGTITTNNVTTGNITTANITTANVTNATFTNDGAGWIDLPLNTGGAWTAPSDETIQYKPKYRKDSFGRVWLRGHAVRGSGSAGTIGTLPVGFRPAPSGGMYFVVPYNNGGAYAVVQVAGNGAIVAIAGPGTGATDVDLAGVAFYV